MPESGDGLSFHISRLQINPKTPSLHTLAQVRAPLYHRPGLRLGWGHHHRYSDDPDGPPFPKSFGQWPKKPFFVHFRRTVGHYCSSNENNILVQTAPAQVEGRALEPSAFPLLGRLGFQSTWRGGSGSPIDCAAVKSPPPFIKVGNKPMSSRVAADELMQH